MNEARAAIASWIETLEILRDALVAEDRDRSFEAITILLMQLVAHAGPTHPTCVKMMPNLLKLKQIVPARRF